MPPRKRARRSGDAEVAELLMSSPPRSSASPPPGLTTAAMHSAYRTRHRRVFRGPEVAATEGGRDDLVPPSDDDEYDEWRAVRAVERAEVTESVSGTAPC